MRYFAEHWRRGIAPFIIRLRTRRETVAACGESATRSRASPPWAISEVCYGAPKITLSIPDCGNSRRRYHLSFLPADGGKCIAAKSCSDRCRSHGPPRRHHLVTEGHYSARLV